MYRVEFKPNNAVESWAGYGSFGSEAAAMQTAQRIAGRYFAVRVTDPNGQIIWTC